MLQRFDELTGRVKTCERKPWMAPQRKLGREAKPIASKRCDVPLDAALARLDAIHLDVCAHGRNEAVAAAQLYPVTREFGAGLENPSCTALAIAEGLLVLTADQELARLKVSGLKLLLAR